MAVEPTAWLACVVRLHTLAGRRRAANVANPNSNVSHWLLPDNAPRKQPVGRKSARDMLRQIFFCTTWRGRSMHPRSVPKQKKQKKRQAHVRQRRTRSIGTLSRTKVAALPFGRAYCRRPSSPSPSSLLGINFFNALMDRPSFVAHNVHMDFSYGVSPQCSPSTPACSVPTHASSQPSPPAPLCFTQSMPRAHMPYPCSAPTLSAIPAADPEDCEQDADSLNQADFQHREEIRKPICASLRLLMKPSKPIPVPKARPRARVTPVYSPPPLPDARPIVAHFLRREARKRGEVVDSFVETPANNYRRMQQPWPFDTSAFDDPDEIVPGRPETADAYLRRRAYFDERDFF